MKLDKYVLRFHSHYHVSSFTGHFNQLFLIVISLSKSGADIHDQAKKEIIEATPEEKIERLEMAKAKLMTRRTELETKIGVLKKKQEGGAA